ncbi:fatty acid desaturase family protein [Streptomyces tendae]|uniref:fatty acid desaturase family protein n=1 Tax=Streptomyces tendae TaxID=1932 RepID=UPI0036A69C44
MNGNMPEGLREARDLRRLSRADARIFAVKLVVLAALSGAAVLWIVLHGWLAALPAQLLLGTMFAHAVELQHQALHGTGLMSRRLNRWVGVALGVPMLVSYSRYRSLHLLHHRYLGTGQDTEFFQYGYNQRLTPGRLLASAFNVRRWLEGLPDVAMSLGPVQRYEEVISSDRIRRRIRTEYRITLGFLLTLAAVWWWTGSPVLVTLWLIPLLFAEPVHVAIELPEHLFCDRTSQNVFHSTRTVAGSWFSRWLTNANNLHVEHHLSMTTPMNKLPAVHTLIADRIEHQSRTYWEFYREVARRAFAGDKETV